jgi:hypothetical protein
MYVGWSNYYSLIYYPSQFRKIEAYGETVSVKVGLLANAREVFLSLTRVYGYLITRPMKLLQRSHFIGFIAVTSAFMA